MEKKESEANSIDIVTYKPLSRVKNNGEENSKIQEKTSQLLSSNELNLLKLKSFKSNAN